MLNRTKGGGIAKINILAVLAKNPEMLYMLY